MSTIELDPPMGAPKRFPKLILSGVLVLAIVAGYWQTLGSIEHHWRSSGAYGHGYLVLVISLYLAWKRVGELSAQPLRPGLWALPWLLLFSGAWFVAHVVDVQVAKEVLLLCILASSIWAMLGLGALKVLLFPIVYLLVAIPIWSILIPTLQDGVSLAATRSLQILGIPVYLEGHYISIPEGRFEIARVCSGLRYLLATLSIAALYSYLNFRKLGFGVAFLLIATFLSIVFNWIRVDTIIVAGHLSDMRHPLVRSHIEFGWVVFAVGLVPIFVIGRIMENIEARGQTPSGVAAGPPPAQAHHSGSKSVTVLLLAVVAAMAGPIMANIMDQAGPTTSSGYQLQAPLGIGGWQGPENHTEVLGLSYAQYDAAYHRSYNHSSGEVGTFVAWFESQHKGKELVTDKNRLFDRERWSVSGSRTAELAVGSRRLSFKETEVVSLGGHSYLIWHVYLMPDGTAIGELEQKLVQAWSVLRGRRGAAVVVLYTEVGDDREGAQARLTGFVENVGQAIIDGLDVQLARR